MTRIAKVTCSLLRIPFTFPLIKEEQHAFANFIEIETDGGIKGHALSTYPLKHGIREAPGPVNGYLTLPTAPGLGFTPKAGILELAVQ